MEGYVRVIGLQRCARYNSSVGRIIGTAESSAGRVVVALQNGHQISVKTENLVLLDMVGASQTAKNWFEEAICGADPSPFRYPISLRRPPAIAEMDASRTLWVAEIHNQDPLLWRRAQCDIYRYLVLALVRVLKTARGLGRNGSSGLTWPKLGVGP